VVQSASSLADRQPAAPATPAMVSEARNDLLELFSSVTDGRSGQVLGQINLNGKIVTADALHTVKATAEFICDHGGEFVLPVKENRQALFDALDALPWHQVSVAHSATDRGHGRITTRTIQVMPAPEGRGDPQTWRCRTRDCDSSLWAEWRRFP
jgi:predicted transposase YbfD/YdcC